MKTKITNRYNDTFTFTDLENGNVLWEGNFEFHRYGFPNIYIEAYNKYIQDRQPEETLTLEEFKIEVHRQIYDKDEWVGPCTIARKYAPLVKSNEDVIDMVDPSGGPYLTVGSKIHNKVIKGFIRVETGYEIITI